MSQPAEPDQPDQPAEQDRPTAWDRLADAYQRDWGWHAR
jgi:hypothetical protein